MDFPSPSVRVVTPAKEPWEVEKVLAVLTDVQLTVNVSSSAPYAYRWRLTQQD
jgi:hypothetical protein